MGNGSKTKLGTWRRVLGLLLAWSLALPPSVPAMPPVPPTELKKNTLDTFQKYVDLTERRIGEEERTLKNFLWVDGQPEPARTQLYQQLRNGQLVLQKMQTLDDGQEIKIKDGLIHHWLGVMFIPGAKMEQATAVTMDYDNHFITYKPDVARSKLISRNGNDMRMMLRFSKKKVILVVVEVEQDVHFTPVDAQRAFLHAYSRRVQEVENPGEKDERLLPQGNDRGFLWHLYTYWRYEERDGGSYIQCESITLTRDIPWILRAIIGPYIRGIPKESLEFVMTATSAELRKRASTASAR